MSLAHAHSIIRRLDIGDFDVVSTHENYVYDRDPSDPEARKIGYAEFYVKSGDVVSALRLVAKQLLAEADEWEKWSKLSLPKPLP